MAKVISAFPACGKSVYYTNWSQYSEENVWRKRNEGKQVYNNIGLPCGERVLDSDSSLFSWVYDEFGNKTDVRNSDFPQNYIQHIKENLDTQDIIFVSSHKVVRDALKSNDIEYCLVYPKREFKQEWINRYKKRGNDDSFIKFQEDNWDKFIDELEDEKYPTKVSLTDMQYLSDVIGQIVPRFEC